MLNNYNKKRDRFFLFAALIGFLFWIASRSPLRMWANITYHQYSWFFGVLPDFLAACTFTFWMSYAVKSKPIEAMAYSAVLIIVAEFIQLYIPIYTFDLWDMLAGLIGIMVSMPLLVFREQSKVNPGCALTSTPFNKQK